MLLSQNSNETNLSSTYYPAILNLFSQTSFENYLIDSLQGKSFYFVGQGHNNAANTIIEERFLTILNKKIGLRYDILETSHSAAFLINKYLQSGQDSFLRAINEKADFNFIKKIKAHNDSVNKNSKIVFWGVDFENRHDGKWTKKALELIASEITSLGNDSLKNLLLKPSISTSESIEVSLKNLRAYIEEHESECRFLLGEQYLDVLLIANSQIGLTYARDKHMFSNFLLLYKELHKKENNPKFFASFGIGHANPENKKGFAMTLLKSDDSPVKNDISIIGVQYFNSQFNKNEITKTTYGNLDFLCKKGKTIGSIEKENNVDEEITILNKNEFYKFSCGKEINYFSCILLVKNYKATTYWTWE